MVSMLFSFKKGSNVTCDNMDDCKGHYAKDNKPVTEEQILCDLTCIKNLKESGSRKYRVEWSLPGPGGRGHRKVMVRGHSFIYAKLVCPRDLLYFMMPLVNTVQLTFE